MPSSSSDSGSSSSDSEPEAPQQEPDAKKRRGEEKSGRGDGDVEVSSGGSDSGSGSESESESEKQAKKKKEKEKDKKAKKKDKKSKKEKKKDKKGKKDKKKAKKDKKKGKKDKKDKKGKKDKAKREAVSNQYGKYGVIKQEDFFAKKPEFLLWAMEVKKENTDAMGQMQLKDLFKDYVEDYNTATMPSKKYYNLQVWDNEQLRKKRGKINQEELSEAQRAALASFDDERARREEIHQLRIKKQEMQITDEVRRMRQDKGKAEEMRHQERLRTQMDLLNKSGHTKEALKIAERLDPSKDEFGRPAGTGRR